MSRPDPAFACLLLEPQWRRLYFEYRDNIDWRYQMGGLIPNRDSFQDPINSINRPLQMGSIWLGAKYKSGMPLYDRLWFENPSKSSFPALTMNSEDEGKSVLVIGYRPYEALKEALHQLAPKLQHISHNTDELEYRSSWGSITEREVQEVLRQATVESHR